MNLSNSVKMIDQWYVIITQLFGCLFVVAISNYCAVLKKI